MHFAADNSPDLAAGTECRLGVDAGGVLRPGEAREWMLVASSRAHKLVINRRLDEAGVTKEPKSQRYPENVGVGLQLISHSPCRGPQAPPFTGPPQEGRARATTRMVRAGVSRHPCALWLTGNGARFGACRIGTDAFSTWEWIWLVG